MAAKTNGTGQGVGFHRLPQIPTMSRNAKIAQSKPNSIPKPEGVTSSAGNIEGTVIHIEGTSKVVTITSDGDVETTDLLEQFEKEIKQSESTPSSSKKTKKQKGTPKINFENCPEPKVNGNGIKSSKDIEKLENSVTDNAVEEEREYFYNDKEKKDLGHISSAGRLLPRTVLLRETEKPSDAQIARLIEGKGVEFHETIPVQWNIGDVVWGHVSGHPWWPGMISSDPFSGLYTTTIMGTRRCRQYFVQYFGDEAERGWVRSASCMSFEGKKKFSAMGDAQIKVSKGAKKKQLQVSFVPTSRRKPAWDLAVDEAEDAITINKDERINKYTFVYEFLPMKKLAKVKTPTVEPKRGVKRKDPDTEEEDDSDDTIDVPVAKRPKKDVATPRASNQEEKTNTVDTTVIKKSKKESSTPRAINKEEGSFEAYCVKHRDGVKEDHPEYDGQMIIQALKQQWSLMSQQQKLKYKSKFSNEGGDHGDANEGKV